MADLNPERILGLRLHAHGLTRPRASTTEAVARLGAAQSQDRGQSLVAVGLRTPGSTYALLEADLDEGRLIRTHALRPTWHLVAAEDLRWILGLTGPRVDQALGSINRGLGLTPDVLAQTRRMIARGLEEGIRTREELIAPIVAAGFPMDGQRAAHYLLDAETHLIACSGPRRGKENTYDLVDRRVAPQSPIHRDEALARLAQRYIGGHGPATAADFSWWSGLTLADARRGLESASELTTTSWDDRTVWFVDAEVPSPQGFHWLAGFDEYVVAYTDRSAFLDPASQSRAMTKNGIFPPVVLFEGRIVGLWKRDEKPKSVDVTVEWFQSPPPGAPEAQAAHTQWLRNFLEKP